MDGKDVKQLLQKENRMQWPVAMDYIKMAGIELFSQHLRPN